MKNVLILREIETFFYLFCYPTLKVRKWNYVDPNATKLIIWVFEIGNSRFFIIFYNFYIVYKSNHCYELNRCFIKIKSYYMKTTLVRTSATGS